MLYVNLISVLKKEANSSILDNNDFQRHSHTINSSIMSSMLTLLSTFILFYLQFSNKTVGISTEKIATEKNCIFFLHKKIFHSFI